MSKFPARVHPILARKANTAVIIRRGPSKSFCTILWDRTRDEFILGQWFKGRIYERRCDLSPDGEHFIYFAMNGKWSGPVKGSWTAISRTPYLKALALWPWGDCWNGGGLFLSDNKFWRNTPFWRDAVSDNEDTDIVGNLSKKLTEDTTFPFEENYGGECPGVYYIRLQRDGWKLLHREFPTPHERVTVFEKELPCGWVFEKTAHASMYHPVGKGCYYDTHHLIHAESGQTPNHPEWEWAELDGKRLVWVTKGVLYAASIHGNGLGDAKMLHDFNDMEFEAIEAPY
jgi:hypothetical protein